MRTVRAVCPHDCPSVCALDVELDGEEVHRVRGAKDHDYTRGVICAKVSRYRERIHHPDRLLKALMRKPRYRGDKSYAQRDAFEEVALSDAIDHVAEQFDRIARVQGAEAIWPFHFAGTMGLVQRDGLDRFRHAMGTSLQHSTYCTTLPDAGWAAGAGSRRGSDVRLMRESDLVVVWGGNPVNTQVNVMHYVAEARRERQARFVVVDAYRTRTAEKADLHLMPKPGTDGALACAVMHVLFRDGHADREFIETHTSGGEALEVHLDSRDPAWAAAITGISAADIETFAAWYGATKKSFLRLGYGFARSRNGAVNMHAASCLPAVTGAWRERGGGALYANGALYGLDKTLISGSDIAPPGLRVFDQSRIGRVLCGDDNELQGGAPVQALFVQNTNPVVVAPETARVLTGLRRTDLFTVVHEQFLTETAALADVVLPATMFLEHDDLYTASGHTHLQVSPRYLAPPGDTLSNHDLLRELARRLGLSHPGFAMSDAELVDATLHASGLPSREALLASKGSIDLALDFASANFSDGFDRPAFDQIAGERVPTSAPLGKFRFAPDWPSIGPDAAGMPALPDHWSVIDVATDKHPLRLVAAPARQFLNTSFTETASARRMEGEPHVRVHAEDLDASGLQAGALGTLYNALGEVSLVVREDNSLQPGTVVVEGLWPNAAFAGGLGINTLVSADAGKPDGGAVYHDTAVGLRPYAR